MRSLQSVLALLVLSLPAIVRGQFDDITDCPMLLESEIGDTNAPSNLGLLAEALSFSSGDQGRSVQLLQVNVVCLVQGTVNGTYRSTSLIATYREAGATEDDITQLHLQCVNGGWSTNNLGTSTTAASVPTLGDLTTELRTDCQLCINPIQGGGAETPAEHCFRKFKCVV